MHSSKILVNAGEVPSSIYDFFEDSKTKQQPDHKPRARKKLSKPAHKRSLTPPVVDLPIDQGPLKKRQKIVHEEVLIQLDSHQSEEQYPANKKRRMDYDRGSPSMATASEEEQEHLQKRRKIVHEQNLTPPDTDSSEKSSRQPGSTSEHRVVPLRLKRQARSINDYSKNFFTLARVEMTVVFPLSDASRSTPSDAEEIYKRGVPVLLKHYSENANGSLSCRVKRLDSDSTFEFEGVTKLPLGTIEVLRQVIKNAANRKDSRYSSVCWLSKASWPVEGAVDEEWKLCCKLLARNATSLSDHLPIKPKDLFESYVCQQPPSNFGEWSPREFYENVYVPRKVDATAVDNLLGSMTDDLKCDLYPFQKRAVRWLLQREGRVIAETRLPNLRVQENEGQLPHGFVHTNDADGKDWLVSRCLSIATRNKEIVRDYTSNIKGGILCEEMGLGKTVEMIALMCLHRFEDSAGPNLEPSEETLVRSPATLIITPPAILRQWESELQHLAPHLKVMIYEGVRKESKNIDNDQLVARLVDQDVVLTTYNVLGREVHYTAGANPLREMRYKKVYERRKCPLTQIMWWRVVLDEAQMVESGASNAAKVAQVIPREHAWAVTGTPVQKDSQDLLGLLIFLRFQPYSLSTKLWNRMIQNHRDVFRDIFKNLALRHTKDQIKDELQLPPQTRVIINVPFTQIEEQHYSTMYQEMCKDLDLDVNGAPLKEDWDPNSAAIIDKMRTWLARLRQTCLHPEVGSRNRRALGTNKGPLRTVDEVLEVMTEQNETASRTEERMLLTTRIQRGQVLEYAEESLEALTIWKEVLREIKLIVKDDRQQLKLEIAKLGLTDKVAGDNTEVGSSNTARIGVYRHRLRSSLEIEHMCTFFIANAYYQLKTKTSQTESNMDNYRKLEKAEERTYELAKKMRQEMLGESSSKADAQMKKVRTKVSDQDVVRVPYVKQIQDQGGIESRNILAKIQGLFYAINNQTRQLDEWRKKLTELVLLPLVDKEDSDLEGNEYETSTKQQDEVYVYMDALRAIVSDRHNFLTGQTNSRIDNEMIIADRDADAGVGHCPALLKELLHVRAQLKSDYHVGSIRGVISEMRELKTTLRSQLDRGNTRAGTELLIVNATLGTLQAVYNEQNTALIGLDRELELLKDTVDSRLEYYRQLQHISDMVSPLEDKLKLPEDQPKLTRAQIDESVADLEATEAKSRDRLAMLKSRGRYLIHLRTEATSLETQRQCIICRDQFERGVLTSCGHSYCVECARLWWNAHRNCPTCKKTLSRNDFYQITYKPGELTMHEEVASTGKPPIADNSSGTIYSGITTAMLNQIKNIDINGSYGTKIDTLARHLLWIRENDPGAKCVIFSQFRDFLDVLGKAFNQFKIAFANFDKPDGVRKFKNDASIECFFLHAKAQSSGLNLVNATHVFLCEPLINTAIELQAIARVHRIGQHQPTTVWMYLVEDTVEKSIYEISVDRRMSLISHAATSEPEMLDSSDVTERNLDAANTLELQQASLSRILSKGPGGGEMVGKEDLWNCLFRRKPEQTRQAEAEADEEVARHLRASAAEGRQDQLDVIMEGTA